MLGSPEPSRNVWLTELRQKFKLKREINEQMPETLGDFLNWQGFVLHYIYSMSRLDIRILN